MLITRGGCNKYNMKGAKQNIMEVERTLGAYPLGMLKDTD